MTIVRLLLLLLSWLTVRAAVVIVTSTIVTTTSVIIVDAFRSANTLNEVFVLLTPQVLFFRRTELLNRWLSLLSPFHLCIIDLSPIDSILLRVELFPRLFIGIFRANGSMPLQRIWVEIAAAYVAFFHVHLFLC